MAKEFHHSQPDHTHHPSEEVTVPAVDQLAAVESEGRGLFGFTGKKEERNGRPEYDRLEEVVAADLEKKNAAEPGHDPEQEEKHHTLVEEVHRFNSSSSSSSDEEEGEGGENKKKKKGLKEKIKEKASGEDDSSIPTERPAEEKNGFAAKIKEMIPGQHKKIKEVPPPPPHAAECRDAEEKGIFEKIAPENIPGHNKKIEKVPPPPAAVECVEEAEPKEQSCRRVFLTG